jgi:hypothetical protein
MSKILQFKFVAEHSEIHIALQLSHHLPCACRAREFGACSNAKFKWKSWNVQTDEWPLYRGHSMRPLSIIQIWPEGPFNGIFSMFHLLFSILCCKFCMRLQEAIRLIYEKIYSTNQGKVYKFFCSMLCPIYCAKDEISCFVV